MTHAEDRNRPHANNDHRGENTDPKEQLPQSEDIVKVEDVDPDEGTDEKGAPVENPSG